ncbi:MAG: hypothetical protein CML05_07975 [Pseudozobellia sp.]|nr:hypothetical protein [Pseudozobellia sp.]
MKTTKVRCAYCHDIIETKYVYAHNNQVYVKNNTEPNSMTDTDWSPINFQWIPVLQLHERLEIQ